VNQAIAQMDEVTQQNAALVEQAAAAAESMQEDAENLSRAVATFRTEEAEAPAREAAEAPPVVKRHAPSRAANVEWLANAKAPLKAEVRRAPARPSAASKVKSGTDGDWTEF
jgi:hypothetical protein